MSLWRCLVAGFVLVGFLAASGQAQTNAPPHASFTGVGEATPAVWTVASGPSNTLVFTVKCAGFRAAPVEGGYALEVPGQARSGRTGEPDVPRLPRIISGRKGCRMVVESSPGEPWREVSNITVAAVTAYVPSDDSGKPVLRSVRVPDPVIYTTDSFFPAALAGVQEAWMGTQKLARLEAVLVQFNPVTHVVRYTTTLKGVIRFEPVTEPSER